MMGSSRHETESHRSLRWASLYENLDSGIPAPPAAPDDLKRLWEFVSNVRADLSPRESETGAVSRAESFGIDSALLAEHCSPSANVPAVMFRCQFLELVVQQGLLAPWLHGGEPDEFLFRVFAAYPIHVGEFDTASLLRRIREKQPRLSSRLVPPGGGEF